MSRRLFVGNLPFSVDEDALRRLAAEGGRIVEDVVVVRDRESGRSRGFGFVTFARDQDARNALEALDGRRVGNRELRVNEAEERATRREGGGRPPHRPRRPERREATREAASSAGPRASGAFTHPYNFVSVPAGGLGPARDVQPFARTVPASHDRFDPNRLSGHLDCMLTTKTPWFIPDPRKRTEDPEHNDHAILGYFTLDPVVEDEWKPEDPGADGTRPAIPGASIRGMVRSVFEAATMSCFAVFDGGPLDFRIGFDPSYKGTTPRPGRGQATYVPVRILRRNGDRSIDVQLLDGRRSTDAPNVLPLALVRAYTERVLIRPRRSSPIVGTPTSLWAALGALPDGARVAAVLKPSLRRGKGYQFREAKQVVAADQFASLTPAAGEDVVFGYLHRTGPNIERKHDERIFFRWAPYNDSGSPATLSERYEDFLADESPTCRVTSEVVEAATRTLEGYADRGARDVKRSPKPPRSIVGAAADDLPYASDFVGARKITSGALFYALIETSPVGQALRGLYPVAVPRLTHADPRASLLPEDFHPCDEPDELCAACRVFGWVRPGERRAPEPHRIDAMASHVRFSHAVQRGGWGDTAERRASLATLAILGSPRPTTTAFYLQPKDGFDDARSTRWPPVLTDAFAPTLPFYRREEAVLRGRKFYRRRSRINASSHDPLANGILRPPENGQPKRDSQNQTVHLLPEGMEFGFRVVFDNLTGEEFGALLFALTLRATNAWGDGATLRHALGHGKPLGMGAAEIRIDALHLDSFDPALPDHRYARIPDFASLHGLADPPGGAVVGADIQPFIDAFAAAWAAIVSRSAEFDRVRAQLVEMLRADPPSGPVHYPPNPDGTFDENFEWFKTNRRTAGRLLPDPLAERRRDGRLRVEIE
jgi:CRISPR-associated protein (TIGR03986 family)